MIHGTGIDLLDARRIADSLQKHGDRLARRVLREEEFCVFQERGGPQAARAQRFLASRFAAKEAFAKAWGTGIGESVGFHDLSILNNAAGAPVLKCHGELEQRCRDAGLQAWVSLSDDGDWVIAQVILERR